MRRVFGLYGSRRSKDKSDLDAMVKRGTLVELRINPVCTKQKERILSGPAVGHITTRNARATAKKMKKHPEGCSRDAELCIGLRVGTSCGKKVWKLKSKGGERWCGEKERTRRRSAVKEQRGYASSKGKREKRTEEGE